MAKRSNLVNLDAMIRRADFASAEPTDVVYESFPTISLKDFTKGTMIGSLLRKPDFQRETNHWSPEQIVSLLDCFVNGDLIPSVILWQSPAYFFVIDGGHRLSVLRAYVEDDYGDGPISQKFFSYQVSGDQKRAADKTRKLVSERIGTYQHFQQKTEDTQSDRRIITVASRGIPIQWVKGDADKAENSFFKINTEGTPLDEIEELLLRNRRKPIPIAARAVIRAGTGHRYWSSFESSVAQEIESKANELHQILFEPEITRPIKTLDLPLGGAKGLRTALQVLIDFILIANQNQQGAPAKIETHSDDTDGGATIECLKRSLRLAKRITGNDSGSLGLHPAVYFYGPTGRHSGPMFMGTIKLIGRKLSENNKEFFKTFTTVREKLEDILIRNKDLMATILQKHISSKRVEKYYLLLEGIVDLLSRGQEVSEQDLVVLSELSGKVVIGTAITFSQKFSDDTKSEVFIYTALKSAIKCPICKGYIDTDKSVSYDHIERVREEGRGSVDNCQLTHPYCNQSVKQ